MEEVNVVGISHKTTTVVAQNDRPVLVGAVAKRKSIFR